MRHRFFLALLFLLGGLLTIGIVTLARHVPSSTRFQMIVNWQYIFVGIIAAVILIGLVKKFRSRLLWEVFFFVSLFLGVWFALLLFLPIGWAFVIAATLILAQISLRIVAVHNLFYLVGGAGVAINFAGLLSPEVLLAGLVAFTLYDMVAGPPGGSIESLSALLVQKGIVPGLIVPARVTDVLASVDDVLKGHAVLLGASDLILPLALVARAAFHGPFVALIVLLGLLGGALLFVTRTTLHPRAALPALAAGAAIPFLLLRFFSLL